MYQGEEQESSQLKQRFGQVYDNANRLILWQLALNIFQYAYSFVTIVIPSAIVASRVISGELEVGRAIQAAGGFAAILSALAVIVDSFQSPWNCKRRSKSAAPGGARWSVEESAPVLFARIRNADLRFRNVSSLTIRERSVNQRRDSLANLGFSQGRTEIVLRRSGGAFAITPKTLQRQDLRGQESFGGRNRNRPSSNF